MSELRDAWPEALPDHPLTLAKVLELAFSAKGAGFVFAIDE